MIDPQRFRIKSGDESFSPADFEECPAWSEFYDREELETIASWGVSRDAAVQAFANLGTGGSHPNYTILDPNRLPFDHLRIFLKATFAYPGGGRLAGYVMNRGELVIGLFVGCREFVLSRHPAIRSMAEDVKKEIEGEIGIAELLPLSFEADFMDLDGNRISGSFAFSEG